MAKTIEIYTTPYCPYCLRAKALLKRKGVAFRDIDVAAKPEGRKEMVKRAKGHHTVPQIFVDGRHIGDCDEIHAMDKQGTLDPILGVAA